MTQPNDHLAELNNPDELKWSATHDLVAASDLLPDPGAAQVHALIGTEHAPLTAAAQLWRVVSSWRRLASRRNRPHGERFTRALLNLAALGLRTYCSDSESSRFGCCPVPLRSNPNALSCLVVRGLPGPNVTSSRDHTGGTT
jgi:hypothetical protein